MATDQRQGRQVVLTASRVLSAALLIAMAVIHLVLWLRGYRDIPLIGVAFLVNSLGGLMLAVALLAVPVRWLPAAALVGAVFIAGTLAGLVASLTIGLADLVETLQTPLVPTTLVVEPAGLLVLMGTAVLAARTRS